MLTLRGNLTAGLVQVIKGKGVTALGLPAGLNAQIARLGDRWPAGPANRSSACQSIYIHTPKLAGAQPLPADAFLSGLSCAKCKACLLELAFVCSGPLKLRAQAAKSGPHPASTWTADVVFTPSCAAPLPSCLTL